ncbi:type I glyceraldehyde-3-phosphate dehydrogenase [Chitinivorax sp. PXF-14]|uniref:type I glyceraldehyde-3-phosphate dehydrogenase n=1 Tax=Chitinivorax sp. PXF-14 TaxID=3230488 RepID=UPI003465F27C
MTIRLAINGYGRIGRNTLRALYEAKRNNELQIVAVNTLGDTNINAHLTQFDSVHGPFNAEVKVDGSDILVNGDRIHFLSERDPAKLPWGAMHVDVVLECTGLFTSKHTASAHLVAGAKKVVISAPGGTDVDATVVYGVNHQTLKPEHTVISNASCTTNCLAPVAKALNDKLGIVSGLMTTIHSYTNDQVLTDVYHSDLRRARSATQSMIPTKTGAASALGLVLPELAGRLDGMAVRVPTINVSLVDLVFQASRPTTKEEVNAIVQEAAAGALKDVLKVNTLPLVSVDFNHNAASSIFDATQTKVVNGTQVKIMAWYDNEWGYSNRMLDAAKALMTASHQGHTSSAVTA